MNKTPTIAIAGATGFIGRWFMATFQHQYRLVALSRKEVAEETEEVFWRKVDLYSLSSTEHALEGCDLAIYLVHSMMPSARLTQSRFEDTDLLLADNFARGAAANNLKQIIFIGGILPPGNDLSTHLRSRYEVEQTLASYGTPVTSLRAGIIVGPGGSSFRIIEKLVERLPLMICPKWAQSATQPISVRDVLKIMERCILEDRLMGKVLEIGGPDVLTYQKMLEHCAEVMQKKSLFFRFNYFTPGLSKLWVSLFTGTPLPLISPLVESLKHEMVAKPHPLKALLPLPQITYIESVHDALLHAKQYPKLPTFKNEIPEHKKERNTVRSVQRLINPKGKDAYWVARAYQKWLPRFFRFLITVKNYNQDDFSFHLLKMKKPLLKLHFVSERSFEERQLFYIKGGLLAQNRERGWLEFREVLNRKWVIAAIHGFVPTLPWYLYLLTQAPLHLWVMKSFGRYLENRKETLPKNP